MRWGLLRSRSLLVVALVLAGLGSFARAVVPATAGAASRAVPPVTGLDARVVNDVDGQAVIIRWVSPMTTNYDGLCTATDLSRFVTSAAGKEASTLNRGEDISDMVEWPVKSLSDESNGMPWYVSEFVGRGTDDDGITTSWSQPATCMLQWPAVVTDTRYDIPGCPLQPSMFVSQTTGAEGTSQRNEVWRVQLDQGETFAVELLDANRQGDPKRASWGLRLFTPTAGHVSEQPLLSVSHPFHRTRDWSPVCSLRYQAPAGGVYYVEVTSSGATYSSYALRWWKGATSLPKVTVTAVEPHDVNMPSLFTVDGSVGPKGGPWGTLDCWGGTSDRYPGCFVYVQRAGAWQRVADGELLPDGRFAASGKWRATDHDLKARVYLPAYGLYEAAWSKTFTIKR